MSRWFRHYAGMMADPKFGAVARRAKASRAEVLFVWGCILESAAERISASYAWDADLCAELLACETEHVQRIHDEMQRSGLLGGGEITAWERRQFVSDTSTERSRKCRERRRSGVATLQNAAASPPDTETETEGSEAIASGGEPPLADHDPWPKDPIERLWTEGVHLMRCMEVGDREAKSNIGRWMSAAGGRADDVLAAIRRARDMGTKDPVPLVGRNLDAILKPRAPHANRPHEPSRADRRLAAMAEVFCRGDDEGLSGPDTGAVRAHGHHSVGGDGHPSPSGHFPAASSQAGARLDRH